MIHFFFISGREGLRVVRPPSSLPLGETARESQGGRCDGACGYNFLAKALIKPPRPLTASVPRCTSTLLAGLLRCWSLNSPSPSGAGLGFGGSQSCLVRPSWVHARYISGPPSPILPSTPGRERARHFVAAPSGLMLFLGGSALTGTGWLHHWVLGKFSRGMKYIRCR